MSPTIPRFEQNTREIETLLALQYKDYDPDAPTLEGALVEYCRLDAKNAEKPRHSVCEASTVISARSSHLNGVRGWRRLSPAAQRGTAVPYCMRLLVMVMDAAVHHCCMPEIAAVLRKTANNIPLAPPV